MKPETLHETLPVTTADLKARPKLTRLGDEPVSTFFGRVLEHHGIPQDGSVAISVALHERNANGQPSSRLGDPIPWSEFDDGDFGRPPGTYVVCLKTSSTGKNPIATAEYRIGGGRVVTPAGLAGVTLPPPAPPAAGGAGNAPSPIDPIALFSLILQQNQAAMAQQQQLTNTLLEVALKPQQPRSMFEDLVQLDELLERRASRKGDGDGSAIADAIREVGPGVLDMLRKTPAKPAAPTPPARQIAATPTKPAAAPPASPTPESPEGAMMAALDRLGGLLQVGAKIGGDPTLYADLVSDAFESEQIDLEGTLALFEPGQMASMLAERFKIDAAWLARVEAVMRDDGADEPPFEPSPAAEPTPAPQPVTQKPAKGKKGKA